MPKQQNIWSRAFNRNHEEEEWLEPSGHVLDEIKDRIKGKKKKKVPLFFWVLSAIFSFILLFILLPLTDWNPKNNKTAKSEKMQAVVAAPELENLESESLIFEAIENDRTESDNPRSEKLEVLSKNGRTNLPTQSSQYVSELSTSSQMNQKIQSSISNEEGHSDKSDGTYFDTGPKTAYDRNNDHLAKSGSVFSQSNESLLKKLKEVASNKNTVEEPFLLDNSPLKSIGFTSRFMLMADQIKTASLKKSSISKLKNEIGILGGIDRWIFRLNDNYRSALNPADFSNSNATGSLFGILYRRKLSRNWRLGFDLAHSQLVSTSGHKSTIEYRLENEHGGAQNDLTIDMATPLGFIQSQIVVERLSSGGGLPTQNLEIDLNNEHIINNTSFDVVVERSVIRKGNFELTLIASFGLNYLSKIKNDLVEWSVDHQNFKDSSALISRDQEAFKKLTPSATGGINAKYWLSANYSYIGIISNYSSSLRPIFSQSDFNTHVNIFTASLSAGKAF